jgi:hypothetical protein
MILFKGSLTYPRVSDLGGIRSLRGTNALAYYTVVFATVEIIIVLRTSLARLYTTMEVSDSGKRTSLL